MRMPLEYDDLRSFYVLHSPHDVHQRSGSDAADALHPSAVPARAAHVRRTERHRQQRQLRWRYAGQWRPDRRQSAARGDRSSAGRWRRRWWWWCARAAAASAHGAHGSDQHQIRDDSPGTASAAATAAAAAAAALDRRLDVALAQHRRCGGDRACMTGGIKTTAAAAAADGVRGSTKAQRRRRNDDDYDGGGGGVQGLNMSSTTLGRDPTDEMRSQRELHNRSAGSINHTNQ